MAAPAFDPTLLSPAARRRSLVAVFACVFATGIGIGLSFPLLAVIMERSGIPGWVSGANAAAGAAAMFIVTPFVPMAAARIGAVRLLLLCYAVAALGLVAFPLTQSLFAWFVLRIGMNAALQGLFLVSELWINQIATESHRGRLIGVYGSIVSGGFALGPLIVQGLGTTTPAPFLLGAVMIAMAAWPLIAARDVVPPVSHSPPTAIAGMLLRSPVASGAALSYGAIEMALGAFLAVYMIRLGLSESDSILPLTAWGFGNLLLQPVFGALADRFDTRTILALCAALGLAGAVLLPVYGADPWSGLPLVFVWGGAMAAFYTVGLAHLGARFKGAELSAANGAFALLYAFGTILGPGIAGIGIDVWRPHGLAVVIGAFAGGYFALVLWRIARRDLT